MTIGKRLPIIINPSVAEKAKALGLQLPPNVVVDNTPKLDLSQKEQHKVVQPANTKRIRFSDGKIVALNRKQRRRMKIYNKDLRRDK